MKSKKGATMSIKIDTGVSNISKGRKEFSDLSKTEQAAKIGVEKFRQSQRGQIYNLQSSKTPLGQYVRYKVMIQNACKKALEKFKFKI